MNSSSHHRQSFSFNDCRVRMFFFFFYDNARLFTRHNANSMKRSFPLFYATGKKRAHLLEARLIYICTYAGHARVVSYRYTRCLKFKVTRNAVRIVFSFENREETRVANYIISPDKEKRSTTTTIPRRASTGSAVEACAAPGKNRNLLRISKRTART